MQKTIKIPFYPNLESELRKKGYNYKLLADELGVAPNYITRRMSGEVIWDIQLAFKIANLLGKTVDYLFAR